MALHVAALGEKVIESTAVARSDGGYATEAEHLLAQPTWRSSLEAAGAVEPHVARVASEQLVAPFPGEHDGDRLAGELADQVCGQRRGVGYGFVHVPGDLGEQLNGIGFDDQLVVLSAEVAGDSARFVQLV